jgi:hypothetical protein
MNIKRNNFHTNSYLLQDEVIATEKIGELSNLPWNSPSNRYFPEMETDPGK